MKNSFKIFLLCLVTPFVLLTAQQEKQLLHFTPQAGIGFFNWEETLENGDKLLEEDGTIYQVGLSSKIKFSKKIGLFLYADGMVYFGTIDYDGSLQDNFGNLTPYRSETAYFGLDFTINSGYDFYLGKQFVISPEFGFQYEYWKRDIDNGGQYGYDEFYNLFYIDFGSKFLISLSPSASVFLKIMGEYPVSVSESIDLAARGQGGPSDISLEPGSNFGINLELGATVYGALFSFGYDYLLFSKSDPDQGYHQPESERSIIKLKLGYTF